eukprot:m.562380 g.562380  ORF g.562380 m.562380 type:complete len:58 (+) comp57801_c0_seq18:1004-1177(+)
MSLQLLDLFSLLVALLLQNANVGLQLLHNLMSKMQVTTKRAREPSPSQVPIPTLSNL